MIKIHLAKRKGEQQEYFVDDLSEDHELSESVYWTHKNNLYSRNTAALQRLVVPIVISLIADAIVFFFTRVIWDNDYEILERFEIHD